MLKIHGEAFYRASVALVSFRQMAEDFDPKTPLDAESKKLLLGHTKTLHIQLEILQANVTAIANRRLLTHLDQDKCDIKTICELIWDVNTRLRDELSGMTLFCLESEKSKYFNPTEPLFGINVADRLPLAAPDIESAGKCLALHQSTASVFHLMRVMESGLKELAKMLGIPYAPSWESYINQINSKITAKHKTKGIKWKRDEAFYRDLMGDLEAVKIAWRNPTMHIVRRYSSEEAEDIFRTVRTFLMRLIPRLPKAKDENSGT